MSIRDVVRNISLVSSAEARALYDRLTSDDHSGTRDDGSSILISGGELFNKGAQAMTYTVVDEISRRYPNKRVYLLSEQDYLRDPAEKDAYTFEILPWDSEIQLSLLAPYANLTNTQSHPTEVHRSVRNAFEDCRMILDINGYALSSQMGARMSFSYLTTVLLARMYSVPMYILPQSIGPFDYSLPMRLLLDPLMRTYLPYPKMICPREEDGVRALEPYTRANVRREFDIVLQGGEYDLENIYVTDRGIEVRTLPDDAVGIVPNSKVFERTSNELFYAMYEQLIDCLLELDKEVYVLRHSTEDLELCKAICEPFTRVNAVHMLDDDFDAPELEALIAQFEYMIASRYHSIVHGYKHGVPVVAIGWAVKYDELLRRFDQSQYFFDVRDGLDVQRLTDAVVRMDRNSGTESAGIASTAESIKERALFDNVFEE
ncbi:polysaccharide pyruvyl transferase family protein [Halorubrum trapanicum]|uniref:polysaccharide pyruvyl transferase family protein n=1 Tax=Halorubrum trapanicum TaxID=29284 RepID=UPI000BBB027A|nr:polysaccharide pyruvyl transferase family protein [Halorubrum trapanicum]